MQVVPATWLIAVLLTSIAFAQTETISVELTLCTGGKIEGFVVDHTDHGIVVVDGQTPYVFSWQEIEAGAAFRAKRNLVVFERGGRDAVTAEDHFQLGVFALRRGRVLTARHQFDVAERLDRDYTFAVRDALDAHRRRAVKKTDRLMTTGADDHADAPVGS